MPLSLIALTERARASAMVRLSSPSLSSVVLRLAPSQDLVVGAQFGFQQVVTSSWRANRLRCCWVEISSDGECVTLGPEGEYTADQIARLASAGVEFPPPVLTMEGGILEPWNVLAAVGAGCPSIIRLQVSLCLYRSHLAWWTIAERTDGVRTRVLDAIDGSTLHEHVDHRRDLPGGR